MRTTDASPLVVTFLNLFLCEELNSDPSEGKKKHKPFYWTQTLLLTFTIRSERIRPTAVIGYTDWSSPAADKWREVGSVIRERLASSKHMVWIDWCKPARVCALHSCTVPWCAATEKVSSWLGLSCGWGSFLLGLRWHPQVFLFSGHISWKTLKEQNRKNTYSYFWEKWKYEHWTALSLLPLSELRRGWGLTLLLILFKKFLNSF